ncbi:MAG: J domain-containing protein, partial [Rhodoglobus sp.]
MPESPRNRSPYEVLGVAASASQAELRKAFRKAMRDTHPDTGGDPSRFTAVQVAWERVGDPTARAAYDAGRGARGEHDTFAAQPARPRKDSRPKSRSYGHPGGWRREKFLAQMREWVGRGVTVDDPYDPALVRSAPAEIRHTLADALAEEATAGTLGMLGIGFTVWHDVSTGDPEQKLDHILLG